VSLDHANHAFTRPYSGAKKLVLVRIGVMANPKEGDWCWPGNDYLCRQCGIKERQLQYILRDLEAAGEIEIRRGTGRALGQIRYLSKVDALDFGGAVECTPGVQPSASQGCSPQAPLSKGISKEMERTPFTHVKKGKPEQSRMTLLATEPGGAEDPEAKRARIREQFERSSAG